ncbi:hypothetical protein CAEBREN_10839 [Caenorhabditis brenneri]|uniref:Uncharacterized protein n=1 Tax=Caenorhabditis brenneri TaxID=135651 RepID=G0MKT0_CAEBE|nr:hypothetical protein CAEBREN_10839 [Caenorhabditis brenneri]
MDTVVPVPSSATIENGNVNSGYFTPKGYLNQNIVKEAEAVREKRIESPRFSTTSSEYNVPVSPSSRFPSSSPLIVISPPKDDTATPITVLPTAVRSMPDTHHRSLMVAIIAALLVFTAVVFMLLLVTLS